MKYFFFCLSVFAITSCHQQKITTRSSANKIDTIATTAAAITMADTNIQPDKYRNQVEQGIDFMATGTEPFWSLEIDFDKTMHFKTVAGIDITTPAATGVKAMDANVTRYAGETGKGNLIVQLIKHECTNDMSGHKFPYTVTVDAKYNTDKESKRYEGCGEYLYDYRINDIWVLESINKKKLTKTDFEKGLPLLEINIAQQKAFGHTGCNNINGSIELQGKKIRFEYLAGTREACNNMEFENSYLNSLANHTIPYFIEQGKMHLRVNTDSSFTYRKID